MTRADLPVAPMPVLHTEDAPARSAGHRKIAFLTTLTRAELAASCSDILSQRGRAGFRPGAGSPRLTLPQRHLDAPAPSTSGGAECLSPREVEVLDSAATGRSRRAIGEHLFISERTVANHLTHIYAKLGVKNRMAAVVRAAMSTAPGTGLSPRAEQATAELVGRLVDAADRHCGIEVSFVPEFELGEGVFRHLVGRRARHDALQRPTTAPAPVNAHADISLTLRDGRIYGAFCCISRAPHRPLDERQLAMIRVFADVARTYLEDGIEAGRAMGAPSDRRPSIG